jgi:hypothetical protein
MAKLHNLKTIAEVLNITERWVNKLCKDGVLPKVSRGKYDLLGCVKAYIKFLQQNTKTGMVSKRGDMEEEKLRKLKEEADKLERERLRDEGRTLEAEECYKMMTNTYTSIRQKIMSEVQLTAETKSEILLTLKEAALGR